MNLAEILGADYKEGMTEEEINTALSSKKLADLSTGNYVNKDKSEAETRRATEEIKNLKDQLNSRMTDDEKKDKLIEELQQELKANKYEKEKSKIISSLAEMKSKLEIKNEDKDFNSFVSALTQEDSTKNDVISNYIGSLLQKAYDKGVNDTTKNQIANNNNIQSGSAKGTPENFGAMLGKRVASSSKNNAQNSKEFFK